MSNGFRTHCAEDDEQWRSDHPLLSLFVGGENYAGEGRQANLRGSVIAEKRHRVNFNETSLSEFQDSICCIRRSMFSDY